MTTRASILSQAFAKIGIADYTYSVDPDQRADARRTLNGMLAEWAAQGAVLGYVPSDDADNDGEDMGTPLWADEAIASNLGLRIAPEYGKMPGAGLSRAARRGYDLVVSQTVAIPAVQRAKSPIRGAGYYRRWSF
jgi:hypothetical protein